MLVSDRVAISCLSPPDRSAYSVLRLDGPHPATREIPLFNGVLGRQSLHCELTSAPPTVEDLGVTGAHARRVEAYLRRARASTPAGNHGVGFIGLPAPAQCALRERHLSARRAVPGELWGLTLTNTSSTVTVTDSFAGIFIPVQCLGETRSSPSKILGGRWWPRSLPRARAVFSTRGLGHALIILLTRCARPTAIPSTPSSR